MVTRINTKLEKQLASSDTPTEHTQEKRKLRTYKDINCSLCLQREDPCGFEGAYSPVVTRQV